MPEQITATTLTYGLRELVWGIESEVAVISNLSRRIDEHVRKVNALRATAAERLGRLDVLRAAVDDPHLSAYLSSTVVVSLPQVKEEFPERMYPEQMSRVRRNRKGRAAR